MKSIILSLTLSAALWASVGPLYAATDVTITKKSPIEHLTADGTDDSVTMSTPGTRYTLVRTQTNNIDGRLQVVITDAQNNLYRIDVASTDYNPPVVAPSPTTNAPPVAATAPSPKPEMEPPAPTETHALPSEALAGVAASLGTNAAPTAPASTATTNATPAPAPPPSPALSTQAAALNAAFGLPLFDSGNLWQSSASDLAHRLVAPQESETPYAHSYRTYKPTILLGAKAHSLAIYSQVDPATHQETPAYISILFTNIGDFQELAESTTPADSAFDDLDHAARKDAEKIAATLTSTLGDPTQTILYDLAPAYRKTPDTHEDVNRWDSQGTAFLLSTDNHTYVSLRIMPSAAADKLAAATDESNSPDTNTRTTLDAQLAGRVNHAPNGDVTLTGLPLTLQGPHPYAVPAIWERCLRYVGLPADLMLLAQAGAHDNQEGTVAYVQACLHTHHRRITTLNVNLSDLSQIQPLLDRGIPLVWHQYFSIPVDRQSIRNTEVRATLTDLAPYIKTLQTQAQSNTHLTINNAFETDRVILGYNPTTNEILISGTQSDIDASPRWLYLPTAQLTNQGTVEYIDWQ